mmetsp:Transcript_6438/g.19504  ORF Transcript_6438/g.19504 Transcript_6438/m.19504 type:complete len:210 (-) Transcript_6438:365-994(-)
MPTALVCVHPSRLLVHPSRLLAHSSRAAVRRRGAVAVCCPVRGARPACSAARRTATCRAERVQGSPRTIPLRAMLMLLQVTRWRLSIPRSRASPSQVRAPLAASSAGRRTSRTTRITRSRSFATPILFHPTPGPPRSQNPPAPPSADRRAARRTKIATVSKPPMLSCASRRPEEARASSAAPRVTPTMKAINGVFSRRGTLTSLRPALS